MRIVFAVLLLFIALVASYPAYQDAEDNNDLDLEVRSILNYLEDEQMERSMDSDESNDDDNDDDDDDDDEYHMSKRQGGHNIVDKQSKCEIQCIYEQRNPKAGKGKTVKEAAKICKQKCPIPNKRRTDKNKVIQKRPASGNKLGLREFNDEQDMTRRELYNYLMEQLQENTD